MRGAVSSYRKEAMEYTTIVLTCAMQRGSLKVKDTVAHLD